MQSWPFPNYYIFSRESLKKPLFATGILGRGHTQIDPIPSVSAVQHQVTLTELREAMEDLKTNKPLLFVERQVGEHLDVSKNRGKSLKMDGENKGKPY